MARKTITIPAYVFDDDDVLFRLANALIEVQNEIGRDPESTAAVDALLGELDERAATYRLVDGKIVRE